MSELKITKEGNELLEKIFESPYKLPRQNVGIGVPFARILVVEPRDANGQLVVKRIGTDELVDEASRVLTIDGLFGLFFKHNRGNPKFNHSASGQDIMDWLCDNGLVARAKTW